VCAALDALVDAAVLDAFTAACDEISSLSVAEQWAVRLESALRSVLR